MLCKIPTFILSPFLSGQLSLILFTLKDGFFFFFFKKKEGMFSEARRNSSHRHANFPGLHWTGTGEFFAI